MGRSDIIISEDSNGLSTYEELLLQRDSLRKQVIKTDDGRKLGYVPEKDNLIVSRFMDAGKLLTAKISTHELRGTFHRIGIGIYLVDY